MDSQKNINEIVKFFLLIISKTISLESTLSLT